MRSFLVVALGACLLSCSSIQAKKGVETAVDIGSEVCKKLEPGYAWLCDLSERAVDALIEEIVPGGFMMMGQMDKSSKVLLLQDLFRRIHKARQARDAEPDMSSL